MCRKGENAKKWQERVKNTPNLIILALQSEGQLNSDPFFPFLGIIKVNPAVRKTVGCVHSEILMDFLFLLS